MDYDVKKLNTEHIDKIDYVYKSFPYTKLMNCEFYNHKHSFWEMIFCTKGNAIHYINNNEYSFAVGDVIIMKPESIHNYKIMDLSNYAHYDFYATLDDMKRVCDNLSKEAYEKIANDKKPICFNLDSATLTMLENKLSNLNSLQANSQFENLASINYNTILHFICGLAIENLVYQSSNVPDWLVKLLSEMSNHEIICGKISDVVSLSGFSHGHLCKLFKKYTGEKLIDYFTKLKIDYANVLLKNSVLNILDISSMLGYDSLSHFIMIYKKHNGITPKQHQLLLYKS